MDKNTEKLIRITKIQIALLKEEIEDKKDILNKLKEELKEIEG